jgi:FdhE protein
MTQTATPQHDPIPIGDVARPPFARLPDPSTMFGRRAERLRSLAKASALKSYLIFLADLADVQHRLQDALSQETEIAADTIGRARQFGMPPFDRSGFKRDAAFDTTWARLLGWSVEIVMPDNARLALARVKAADAEGQTELIRGVLSNAVPSDALAEHLFAAAVLEVHFARSAARLDVKSLRPVGLGACPVCGAPPVSSLVVGWRDAQATRFCACSLCGTLWNYPRIKCTLCGATEDIGYQQIAGGSATVKAETCESCRRYVKILHQRDDAGLDPVADDVATLALDILLRDSGFRRGAVNPFLIGY